MAKIFYLMGSSGSGKDSIIKKIRQRELPYLEVAHRYITRDWQAGGENHVALSHSEFERRQELGMFALSWAANEQCYGIGREIEQWLAIGQSVLVNGSRGYLEQATHIWPDIKPVLVTVSLDKLQTRLELRGRENAQQIQERLQRAAAFAQLSHPNLLTISNDATLEEGGQKFYELLTLNP